MTKRGIQRRKSYSLKVRKFINKSLRLIEERRIQKIGERYGYL